MKNLTIDLIKQVFKSKGYAFFENGIFNLNIFGIRSKNSKSNEFDDWICIAYKDENYQWVIKKFPATTDPGKTYLLNPLVKEGTLIMVPGQYKGAYCIGIHGRSKSGNRRYKALEQKRPMCYVRDNNRDSELNFSLIENPKNHIWGIFKTNIHRANTGWLSWLKKFFPIGPNGAGCQVHQYADCFDEMMNAAEKSRKLYGNSFTYTLFNEVDFS